MRRDGSDVYELPEKEFIAAQQCYVPPDEPVGPDLDKLVVRVRDVRAIRCRSELSNRGWIYILPEEKHRR